MSGRGSNLGEVKVRRSGGDSFVVTMMEPAFTSCNEDDGTMNDGSVVGLPNSSSEEEEDSSADELTRAGDALARTLMQEQDSEKAKSLPGSPRKAEEARVDPHLSPPNKAERETVNSDGNEQQPNLAEVETKSTPSPSSSSQVDETTSPSSGPQEMSLEDRVQELETKLATLSRILQQQSMLSGRNMPSRYSPTSSQRSIQNSQRAILQSRLPQMPLMEGEGYDQSNNNNSREITDSPPNNLQPRQGMVPYLESPAPIDDSPPRQRSLHQRKRLSFHLLYDGNEENLALADDETNNGDNGTLPLQPPLGVADDSATVSNDNSIVQPTLPSGNDNNDNEETGKEDPMQHPLKRDSASSPTTSNHSSLSTDKESPTKEGKRNSSFSRTPTDKLADVAARVVDAQNKSATGDSATKDHLVIESSNQSLDESPTKKTTTTPTSKKKTTTTPTSNGSKATPNEERAILPPLPILPPLLSLSKDKRSQWLDHLNSFQESNHDVDRQMQEFIKVPGAVEKTLTSGLLICVDSFLYVWTILPIRFVWSCVLLSLHYFFRWTNKPPGNLQFHRRHMYQLIQVSIIFFIYRYILLPISIGKLYHWIRGQAMIKLYVLIAIVEVFDRLMCSLGQDCLDSLYWNTTRRPRSSRMVISASVVLVYTAAHSLILFLHVATLNVAMNSADEALLALLIAGNFAEIKSTVFKKYNKPSLFKIVASDICERFKLALFLGLVLLLNFCQGMDSRKMSDYQRIAGIVWMSELLCDWLKHAFITKFNFIPSTVYPEYGLLLAGDVTGIGHEGVNLDHSHAVVKRIGFAQMPLVCVVARLVREAAKYMSLRIDSQAVPFLLVVFASAGIWILLLSFKIFLGAYLQRTSLAKLHAAPELSQKAPLKAKQK